MKKENPKLNATVRTITGRKVKQLRNQGIMPSSVYGHGMEPISIQVNDKEFETIFKHAGESSLVELVMGDKILPVLFRNPQYHPVTGSLVHVDCYKVNLKEKIITMVPLEFVGESAAVKLGKVLVEVTTEIEIEALPTDLIEKIEVDLSKLETIESVITVADLIVDRSIIEIKTDAEQVIAKVEEQRVEEEPIVEEEAAPTEVPATEQKTPEELAAAEAERKEEKAKEEKEGKK